MPSCCAPFTAQAELRTTARMAALCEYGSTARVPGAAAADLWQRDQPGPWRCAGPAALPPPPSASKGALSGSGGWLQQHGGGGGGSEEPQQAGLQALGAGWAPLGPAGAAAAAAAREAAVREMLSRNAELARRLRA
jgi:hypothetical protein